MVDYFLDWIDFSSLNVSDDLVFVFVCLASLMILSFIIDFFRFLLYYISGGK